MDRLTDRLSHRHRELARRTARRMTTGEVDLETLGSTRPDVIDRAIAEVEIRDQREEDLNRDLYTAAWMASLAEADGA